MSEDTSRWHRVTDCTSCGCEIVGQLHTRPYAFQFRIMTGEDDEFEIREARLCGKCEEIIVNWIWDEDHCEQSVFMQDITKTADSLDDTAEELEAVASLLRSRLQGESDSSDTPNTE